jgi:hypothetical protein
MITLLVVVAIWRVTRLLVVDEFPPVRAVRMWVISTFAAVDAGGGLVRGRQWGGFGLAVAYVWTCSWCMSIWVGAGLVGLVSVWVSVPVPWLVVAAGSCVAGVMSWVEQEHDQRWAAREREVRR